MTRVFLLEMDERDAAGSLVLEKGHAGYDLCPSSPQMSLQVHNHGAGLAPLGSKRQRLNIDGITRVFPIRTRGQEYAALII